MVRVADRGESGPQSTRLLGETLRVPVRGERLDLEAIRITRQQIHRALTDGSGRPEDGYPSDPAAAIAGGVGGVHRHVRRLRPPIKVNRATTGITASSPSSLSRSPPCPGMRPLESFTPNLRFATDSARSPNCSTIARPALTTASGNPGEIPSHAAVAHPVNAAQTMPPARPVQVLLGLQRDASRGPPKVRPTA